jgi:hypothetical protein
LKNLDKLYIELIASIQWYPKTIDSKKEGDWLTLDKPKRTLLKEFYQIRQVEENDEFFVHIYRRIKNTERLQNVSRRTLVKLPTWKLIQAQIILKIQDEGFTMFNSILERSME